MKSSMTQLGYLVSASSNRGNPTTESSSQKIEFLRNRQISNSNGCLSVGNEQGIQFGNKGNNADNSIINSSSNLGMHVMVNSNNNNSLFSSYSVLGSGKNSRLGSGEAKQKESSKSILQKFLTSTGGVLSLEVLKSSVYEMLQELDHTQEERRRLIKENNKLQKMLEFVQISNKQKDSFFQKMVEQNIAMKNQLDELKLHNQHQQKIQAINALKDNKTSHSPHKSKHSNTFIYHSISSYPISPTNNKTNNTINSSTNITNNNNDQRQVFDRQPSKKWTIMKQALEDHNIIQSDLAGSFAQMRTTTNKKHLLNSDISNNQSTGPAYVQAGSNNNIPQQQISPFSSSQNPPKYLRFARNTGKSAIPTQVLDNNAQRKNLRPLFIQHSTDHAFYSSALDLDMQESDIKEFFLEGKYMKFIKGHFSDETNLRKLIFNLEGQTFKYFYESVNSLVSYLTITMNLILKTKQVILAAYNLQHKMNISEAFDAISAECVKILTCEKAQIFLLDEKSNIFWTKGTKNNDLLKIPLEASGFCSHVVKSCSPINVLDAHLDDRFDKGIDNKSNSKTKSVLCAPIIDSQSSSKRVMGVLQVVNKKDGQFFTKDEEGILKVIALLSENILRNSVFNDERAEFYNSLRFLYNYSIDLIQSSTLEQLFELSLTFLQRSLNIPQARLVIFDEKNNEFYTFEDNAKLTFTTTQGIIGSVYSSGIIKACVNVANDSEFNSLIDIDTPLPLLTLPIQSSCDSQVNKTVGVLQIVNSRGIHSLILQAEKESQVLLTNYDTLQRFNTLFATALQKFMRQ